MPWLRDPPRMEMPCAPCAAVHVSALPPCFQQECLHARRHRVPLQPHTMRVLARTSMNTSAAHREPVPYPILHLCTHIKARGHHMRRRDPVLQRPDARAAQHGGGRRRGRTRGRGQRLQPVPGQRRGQLRGHLRHRQIGSVRVGAAVRALAGSASSQSLGSGVGSFAATSSTGR